MTSRAHFACMTSHLLVPAAVAAVHDGFVLQKATTRAPLGGALLTQATLRAAEAKAPVLPRSVVRRVEKTPGNWEVRLCTWIASQDQCPVRNVGDF